MEDVTVPLEHACLGCAQREDVLPLLAALAASGRADAVVLALPVAAEPAPVVHALGADDQVAGVVRLAGVVAAVAGASLVDDVLGDALLSELGLPDLEGDDRAVGEVLAHQLDEADLVLADADLHPRASALLQHLCGPAIATSTVAEIGGAAVLAPRRPAAGSRADLRRARHHGVPDGCGVWTLELSSPRAFHPGRLLERIEDLGAGRLRARGSFWLPSRPGTLCAWDGAGGRLSIGGLGGWGLDTPRTHLVVTGTQLGDRDRLRAAFGDVLATPAEEAALRERAAGGAGDGLEPWLGEVPAGHGVPAGE
nr:GTP-binding protein [Kineococcus siccus]